MTAARSGPSPHSSTSNGRRTSRSKRRSSGTSAAAPCHGLKVPCVADHEPVGRPPVARTSRVGAVGEDVDPVVPHPPTQDIVSKHLGDDHDPIRPAEGRLLGSNQAPMGPRTLEPDRLPGHGSVDLQDPGHPKPAPQPRPDRRVQGEPLDDQLRTEVRGPGSRLSPHRRRVHPLVPAPSTPEHPRQLAAPRHTHPNSCWRLDGGRTPSIPSSCPQLDDGPGVSEPARERPEVDRRTPPERGRGSGAWGQINATRGAAQRSSAPVWRAPRSLSIRSLSLHGPTLHDIAQRPLSKAARPLFGERWIRPC